MLTYVIQGEPLTPVKIGKASNVEKRLASLQTGNPTELRVLRVIEGDWEQELHDRFADYRLRGEWFAWCPAIEAFVKEPFIVVPGVWHMVNAYCTNEQRQEFNEWHAACYIAAQNVFDWVHRASVRARMEPPGDAQQIVKLIGKCPWLEGAMPC